MVKHRIPEAKLLDCGCKILIYPETMIYVSCPKCKELFELPELEKK